MALQTSIAEYFNLRKRGAVDELKKVTPSSKVLILDKNARGDTSSDGDTSSVRTIVYAESPKSSHPRVGSVPRRSRKTPATAVRRLSGVSRDRKDDQQPDIRKCLWPEKSSLQPELTSSSAVENAAVEVVNVPFRIHSISPKKKPPTPVKAFSTPVKSDIGSPERNPEPAIYSTPTKNDNLTEEPHLDEKTSNIIPQQIAPKQKARVDALKKAVKLADLKNRLKNFNDGCSKLKEIQERKAKHLLSPKLQEFKTIELVVNVSPKKIDVLEESKSIGRSSLLRKALFMSPSKGPPGSSTYVSPRKLFDQPPPATSPTKPAFQLYYDLACAGKPALPLSYKYRCLAETFRSVDTIVSMMFNRNENIVFNKLKSSVQQLSKRNLTESHIGQIMAIAPSAFELKREKIRVLGNHKEQYELVLKPIIPEDSAADTSKNETKPAMSPTVLLQRRRDFYNALLEIAKDHHETFLRRLDPPLIIPKDKLMRWHPDFDVDTSCPDIVPASLPLAPVQEKLSTARDVLIKAKDMLSSNNRMERALERLSEAPTPAPKSETAVATTALAKALKGIPKSLLEKVRAKQAAKTAALLTRCPEETRRRLDLSRLPELARILRNIFILERKNVIPLPVVLEKVQKSYREALSQDDMMRHFLLIINSVPGWISEVADGDKKYLRLSRDADFSRIMNRLNELIDDNKANLII